MTPLYVSYFTPSYAAEASGLVASLERFNLPHDVRPVPSLGTWEANCGFKPTFLLDMMAVHAVHHGRPLVWLDADARVLRPPVLFDQMDGVDFAAHWKDGVELLSGTTFWGATPGGVKILEAWREEQRKTPGEWDQKSLAKVVDRQATFILPPEYVAIFDAGMCDPADVRILHRQASRVLRYA